MFFGRQLFAVILLPVTFLAATELLAQDSADHRPGSTAPSSASASERILENIEEPALRELVGEILDRNPGVAAAKARARAAALEAPQVKALPDPVASLTAFLGTPETRTGPQRLSAGYFQGLPWVGKLALKEQAALYGAAALEAEVEAKELTLVTEARRLYHELSFLNRFEVITEEYRTHLLQHEEISRARYSTGVGLGQGVVKLQAEITKVERELLDIEARRVALSAQINALRDRSALASPPNDLLPEVLEIELDHSVLLETALRYRPELAAANARISRADALIRLAEKGYRPDFKVGLTYTIVDPRDDAPGRLQPPEGNGEDIIGLQGGITLPIWRKKLAAGVEEAVELERAAREARRDVAASIDSAVGDLTLRVPLSWRQLRLVEDLLVVQAEEALESAQAGYIAGTLNALDLLDAEHVLFQAHTAVARAKTDYLVGIAKLEGALGESLSNTTTTE
ncbi:MAG: TolC family protein [Rhodothermales bacterium]|nr:TolC family protein [Rhodothermales bacterium]